MIDISPLILQLFLVVFLIAVNAFFAGAEIAIISIRQSRIAQLQREGNKAAQVVNKLTGDPSRFLSTIQVGVTLAGFLASATAAVSLSRAFADILRLIPVTAISRAADGLAVLLVTMMLAFVTLVFGELAPKRLALQKAETISLWVARPLEWISRLAAPLVWLLTVSTNMVVLLLGGNPVQREQKITEDELRLIIAEQGTLEDEEKEMIQGVFEFGDTVVREVMIPRPDIEAVSCETAVGEALKAMLSTGLSRMPVYLNTLDQVVGVLTLKELLPTALEGNRQDSISTLVRPVLLVPPGKNVLELFVEMRAQRQHIAVVIDEYGITEGLVTLEDLLEEIVGDIEDESDTRESPVEKINDRSMVVDGGLHVWELNEMLGLNLPEPEYYESVGGLVLNGLGRFPRQGDQVTVNNVLLTVEKMHLNRISKVKLESKHPLPSI